MSKKSSSAAASKLKTKNKPDKIDLVLKKLTEHDKRFDSIDKRFTAIDKRFTAIDKRFTAIDKRFTAIDKRFNGYDEQFENNEKKLISIIEAIHDHGRQLRNMATKDDLLQLEHRVIGILDQHAVQIDRLDKEQAASASAIVRLEKMAA